MPVRFYFDADLLGLAKVMVAVRSDVTYPGDPGGVGPDGSERPPCPVRPGAKDLEWIPIVAGSGWLVVTRDRHLRSRPAERAAILEHGARVITLDARHELNKWLQLEIVVSRWRHFEELLAVPGPWVQMATYTGLREVRLRPEGPASP